MLCSMELSCRAEKDAVGRIFMNVLVVSRTRPYDWWESLADALGSERGESIYSVVDAVLDKAGVVGHIGCARILPLCL